LQLEGRYLTKYDSEEARIPHKDRVYKLENKLWQLERKDDKGLVLQPSKLYLEMQNQKPKVGKRQSSFSLPVDLENKQEYATPKTFEIYFDDEFTRNKWFSRIKRLISNDATHGIEIQRVTLENNLIKQVLGNRGNLEVSIWDFAGQHDYYNSHHYFISTRTVFLLLWKIHEKEKGMKGLEFWMQSLAAHLPKDGWSDPEEELKLVSSL